MKNFKALRQLEAIDCGPTCLRMIAYHYGKSFSSSYLRERSYITRQGVSLLGISDAAESIGFRTLGVRLSFQQLLTEAPLPLIAHWKTSHFIVVYKIDKNWIWVANPSNGITRYKKDEFCSGWIGTIQDGMEKGHCLLLEPTPDFYSFDEEKMDRKQWHFLFSYLKPYKALITQLLISFLVISLIQLILPFLTQAVVDRGINYKDVSFLTLLLIAQLALSLGQAAVGFVRGWIMLHLTSKVNISLISDFLSRLMRLPISYFESKITGDLMQRMGDNDRIQGFLTNTAIYFIFSIANFLIFSCIMAFYNLTIFTIFIIGSILYITWVKLFMRYRRELDSRRFAQASNSQSSVIQLLTGMQEIKLNNCEKQKRWEWERIQAMLFKIGVKGLMFEQYQGAGASLINNIKNFTITFFAAKSVIDGRMTLGMMLSVQYIISQMNGPIESLISFMQNWQDAKMSLERLGEIQEREPEDMYDINKLCEIPSEKSISLNKVSFQYGGPRSPYILKDIDLIIPASKTTAIVGNSGSGKTTILKLLLGFYNPTSGEIKIGHTLRSNINDKVWRHHNGAVMQDGYIFSDTIANNIAISDEEVDKKKLLKAVDMANIREFIESLPLGYNTQIGESGLGISQGQKQRLLIARVMYKNPDIVYFDEATNSLDTNNEKIILKNLSEFFENKTVVVVAHRLTTVKNADNIIVLDKGKIVEQGNHRDLINIKGYYYRLVKNQLELSN